MLGPKRYFLIILAALSMFYVNGGAVEETAFFGGLKYRCIGPSRGGRVTAVAGVASASGTFYMGATGGGVWKTIDFGQSWTNISDDYFETGSIGAIAVSMSRPDIIYVGTGSDGSIEAHTGVGAISVEAR